MRCWWAECRRGTSTRSSNAAALRGSTPSPIAARGSWYSSVPSWRLSSCEEMVIGASPSSMVTVRPSSARWRWVIDTIRVDSTLTRLPDGVRQTSERRSTPSRKSRERS